MKKPFLIFFFLTISSTLFASESLKLTNNVSLNFAKFHERQVVNLLNQKKNPFFASVLSMIYSGAGQFYNENYQLGSLLFLGETSYYIANYLLQYHFNEVYGSGISYEKLSAQDLGLLVFSYVAFLSIKSFSMYEAYTQADYRNREIDRELDKLRLSLRLDVTGIYISGRF